MTGDQRSIDILQELRAVLACLIFAFAGLSFANITVVGSLNREFVTSPGAVIEDSIEISNIGNSDAEVRLYLTDYTYEANGTAEYPSPGTLARSNAAWIQLESDQVSVAAGRRLSVPYRIEVPEEGLEGSYWSMIMVEEIVAADAPGERAAIRTVLRYGVVALTTIGGESPSELRFVNPVFTSDTEGASVLIVDILNSGIRALQPRHYIDLFDADGRSIGRIEGDTVRILPDTSVRQQFVLGQLESGSYLAIVVADGGGGDVFGAQYSLNVEDD